MHSSSESYRFDGVHFSASDASLLQIVTHLVNRFVDIITRAHANNIYFLSLWTETVYIGERVNVVVDSITTH